MPQDEDVVVQVRVSVDITLPHWEGHVKFNELQEARAFRDKLSAAIEDAEKQVKAIKG